jgi:hypothetical protein
MKYELDEGDVSDLLLCIDAAEHEGQLDEVDGERLRKILGPAEGPNATPPGSDQ